MSEKENSGGKKVAVNRNIMGRNDDVAAQNRAFFKDRGLLATYSTSQLGQSSVSRDLRPLIPGDVGPSENMP